MRELTKLLENPYLPLPLQAHTPQQQYQQRCLRGAMRSRRRPRSLCHLLSPTSAIAPSPTIFTPSPPKPQCYQRYVSQHPKPLLNATQSHFLQQALRHFLSCDPHVIITYAATISVISCVQMTCQGFVLPSVSFCNIWSGWMVQRWRISSYVVKNWEWKGGGALGGGGVRTAALHCSRSTGKAVETFWKWRFVECCCRSKIR